MDTVFVSAYTWIGWLKVSHGHGGPLVPLLDFECVVHC